MLAFTEYPEDSVVAPPLPPCPRQTEFELAPDETWTPGEVVSDELDYDDGSITITVSGQPDHPRVRAAAEGDVTAEEALWTAVHWCRAYGVTGVYSERLMAYELDRPIGTYRLGGLYRYAGFELTDREKNYEIHGYTPYKPADETA